MPDDVERPDHELSSQRAQEIAAKFSAAKTMAELDRLAHNHGAEFQLMPTSLRLIVDTAYSQRRFELRNETV